MSESTVFKTAGQAACAGKVSASRVLTLLTCDWNSGKPGVGKSFKDISMKVPVMDCVYIGRQLQETVCNYCIDSNEPADSFL